jgi:glutamate carboxypeptidase
MSRTLPDMMQHASRGQRGANGRSRVELNMTDYFSHLKWIDSQERRMIGLLTQWADVNSGTHNLPGLREMLALLEQEFRILGGETKSVELEPQQLEDSSGGVANRPLGNALLIRKRLSAPLRVLLCCHADTVYAQDHAFQKSVSIDDNTLRGPGVTDAKGGIVVLLVALEAFERSPWAEELGWEILINPDEEIGSPGSAPLLVQAAKRNHLGLVFEPSLPDGNLVGARKGSGNFTVTVRGKAAHAGRDPHLGRNAIVAMAGFIEGLASLADPGGGITTNVGYVEGGGPVNVVPDLAICRFNVRVATQDDKRSFERGLMRLAEEINRIDGISLEIRGGFTRPPKQLDEKTLKLLEQIAECGRDLGLSLQWLPSGGACDGNNFAAAGLTTIDSLGVTGGDIHSSDEYILLGSLVERAKLAALLLMKLGAGEIQI